MQLFKAKYPIAITCAVSCVLVIAFFCNRNPMDGDISGQTGTVILKIASLDSIAAKEAKVEAISSMKASLLSGGTAIASQTKNKEAGSTSAQFTFTNLDPSGSLTALVQVFDDNSNEKYRAVSPSFSIAAGQTVPVTLGSWSVSFDQTQSDFTIDPSSVPADGESAALIKLIPRYPSGTAMGSGLTVIFQTTLGTWVDNVAYNSSDQSYTRSIKSTTAGNATISASIKSGASGTTNLTRTVSLSFIAGIAITSDSLLAAGAIGTSYSMPLTATGGTSPYAWSLPAGSSLPGGLSLSSAGVISGTPTDSGAFSFAIRVEDSGNPKQNATKDFSISISSEFQIITTSLLAAGMLNAEYSIELAAAGGTAPYTWVLQSGNLPNGLTLSNSGEISGTPTASGTFTFAVKAEDSSNPKQSRTKDFVLTIYSTPTITSLSPLADGIADSTYSVTLKVIGGTPPYTWSLSSGDLPGGLGISNEGIISGTPTAEGAFTFAVKAEDSGSPKQSMAKEFTITIVPRLEIITKSPLAGGALDSAYSVTLIAIGGLSPHIWSLNSGNLPGGLSLSSSGVISGTPTTSGIFNFIVRVEDSGNPKQSETRQLIIDILEGVITDIDGNVYHTIVIGDQEWMVENLQVTHYRNGDAIPLVTGDSVWIGLATGAYCNYDNNISYAEIYGRLYNWYAVNDSRGLAPSGWRVPSDDDWQTLVDYLGGSLVAGGKLKESGTSHWISPNTGATNESGFTALPGGQRRYNAGQYASIGSGPYFWSSTGSDTGNAGFRTLGYNSPEVYSGDYRKENGLSVRCVRDK